MIARVFVAIGVPPSVRDALAAATEDLRRPEAPLRPTRPAGWHVTLVFLGDLEPDRLSLATEITTEAVAAAAPRPAPWLSLAAAARFGDRVLVVPVSEDPPGALAGFVASLRQELTDAGFDLPDTRFRPHVTLARARRSRRVTCADERSVRVPARRWQPATIGLWAAAADGSARPYDVLAELAWPGPSASAAGPG